jgi:hypothetical protein
MMFFMATPSFFQHHLLILIDKNSLFDGVSIEKFLLCVNNKHFSKFPRWLVLPLYIGCQK